MVTIAGLQAFRSRRREQAGVVVSDGQRTWVVRLPNRDSSGEPDRALTWYDDLLPLLRPGLTVVAFLHTHLPDYDPMPSSYDLDAMPAPWSKRRFDVPGIVYHPHSGTLMWFNRGGVTDVVKLRKRVPSGRLGRMLRRSGDSANSGGLGDG